MTEPDKEIIVIGDIEMGAGNLTDDFVADQTLSELFVEFSQRPHPVDLILNGDTFDFLKCPSRLTPSTEYPRHITTSISLAKLELIHRAHKPVFDALKTFAAQKDKNLFFILGNHDHDLVRKEVQEEIKTILGNKSSIHFPGLSYHQHKVYVEHGHQYDFLFRINLKHLFLNYRGESILNFPFVSFGALSQMMRLKEDHPFLERINPRPALLTHHHMILKKINRYTLEYFIKSLVYYPFRFYSDPTYSFPSHLFRQFYRKMRNFNYDIEDVMTVFKRKKGKIMDKIYVLGHDHQKRISKGRKRVIIHPGTWRDEYDFNSKTRELIPRTKRYVQIEVHNEEPSYKLIDMPLHRSIIDFDDIIKNELKYMRLAAKEEKFTQYLF